MKNRLAGLLPLMPIAALLVACGSQGNGSASKTGSSLTAPGLGTSTSFLVLAGATVTNTGPSMIHGDVGVSPGSAVTGFPPGLQTDGAMYKAGAVALQAQADVTTAYDELAAAPCTQNLTGKDLGGLTLLEGVYCFDSSAQLTGTLTLDAKGKSDAVFIFKTVSTLITASSASVLVINGGSGCNVFWKVGSSATVGAGSKFAGSILALTSIALQTGATVDGRALARNGEVTLDNNVIAVGTCVATDAGVTDTGATTPPEAGSGTDTGTPKPPCDEESEDCT